MDAFEIDPIKAEKAMAARRYRRLKKIASFFRCVEVFLALVFLTWISFRIPIAVRISGSVFKQLFLLVASPRFVFFLGNAIVVTLVAKSGIFSGQHSAGCASSGTDLYQEFLKNSDSRVKTRTGSEIVYQDKSVCIENTNEKESLAPINAEKEEKESLAPINAEKEEKEVKYRRSRSEASTPPEKKPELRRSRTDACEKVEKPSDAVPCNSEAHMDNEEFRRRIEAFIERQQRFQRQESMSIVLLEDC